MTVEKRQIILTEDRHTLKDKTYGSNLMEKRISWKVSKRIYGLVDVLESFIEVVGSIFYFILIIVDISSLSVQLMLTASKPTSYTWLVFNQQSSNAWQIILWYICSSGYLFYVFFISSSEGVNNIPKVSWEGKRRKGMQVCKRKRIRSHVYHDRGNQDFKGICDDTCGIIYSQHIFADYLGVLRYVNRLRCLGRCFAFYLRSEKG